MITMGVSWSWLYRRCALWGLAVGAGAGAGFGAFLGTGYFETVGGAATGALTGAVFAIPVALIPALLGAVIVTDAMERRDDFRRSLGIAFAATAVIINGALLLSVALWGDAEGVFVVLAGNAGALPVLWGAWASITKGYARDAS